jgi:hypothetical protein
MSVHSSSRRGWSGLQRQSLEVPPATSRRPTRCACEAPGWVCEGEPCARMGEAFRLHFRRGPRQCQSGGLRRQDESSAWKRLRKQPDLLEFRPERSAKTDKFGYEIYSCGKAVREGQNFNGVALIHVVFERDAWFFSDWTFTELPNEPCKALRIPLGRCLRRSLGGVPFHLDKPKK